MIMAEGENIELLEQPESKSAVAEESADANGLVGSLLPESDQGLRWRIYASHLLSAWGERMWEFAIGLVSLQQILTGLLIMILMEAQDCRADIL